MKKSLSLILITLLLVSSTTFATELKSNGNDKDSYKTYKQGNTVIAEATKYAATKNELDSILNQSLNLRKSTKKVFDKDGLEIVKQFSNGSYLAVKSTVQPKVLAQQGFTISALSASSTQQQTASFDYYMKNYLGQSKLVFYTIIKTDYVSGPSGYLIKMWGSATPVAPTCSVYWDSSLTELMPSMAKLGLNAYYSSENLSVLYMSSYFQFTQAITINHYVN